jgi:hypothetical protein
LLDQLIGNTAEVVNTSVQALRKYRGAIRENCGLAAATRLDHLLDGPAGKFEIRYAIGALIHNYRRGSKRDDLAAQAAEILGMIDQFNLELIELHDLVLPPRDAPR